MNRKNMKKLKLATLTAAFSLMAILLGDAHGESAAADSGQQTGTSVLIPGDTPVKHNRLINESSPYLLQHATNPVDWYPWGREAFEKAKKENKPIFLSIGYSTCHWCHVMEHESFADKEVAALLNRYFVSVKVDREERPDIDSVYMTVTQALTGSGGWPMTVILTPDKEPFFAGTYFPKSARWGRPGLMDLLPKVAQLWENDRDKVLASARQITETLVRITSPSPGEPPGPEIPVEAQKELEQQYDAQQGGFGTAPKFPTPHKLSFLLRRYYHSGDSQLLAMVETTLTRMRLGGIFDHVGFGFHRYSTDANWRLPHFEKMLYDQALLAMVYAEAYQVTGKPVYARTVREILAYVLRDMTSAEGGFYSAEDADSEGVEGKFYLWSTAEIEGILGSKEAAWFKQLFNLQPQGNFEDQTGHAAKGNIFYLQKPLSASAADMGLSEEELNERLEAGRQKLFTYREKRIHPFKDDKILTDWNGLMIAALAKAAVALNEPAYSNAATKATDFILRKLRDDRGRLLKRYRNGKAGLDAHLNDYAFMVWGLLELYEATFDTDHLKEAIRLNDLMLLYFWDQNNGGLYLTADDSEKLLVRNKEHYDGAIPAGNSVATLNLLRLSHITGNRSYAARSEAIAKAFSAPVARVPAGHAQLMIALEFAFESSYEVVIAGERERRDTQAMLAALREPFIPGKTIILRPNDPREADRIVQIAPYSLNMLPKNGIATAYVCQEFVCQLPTTSIKQMLENLKPSADSQSQPSATAG